MLVSQRFLVFDDEGKQNNKYYDNLFDETRNEFLY